LNVLAAHRVTLVPGDGVGPEVSEATRRVLEATGVEFEWDVQNAGLGVMDKYGTPMPDHVLDSIRRNKVAIKGPLTTPLGKGIRSVNVALRKELDLYALVRPCKSYVGVRSRFQNIDLVIVRENTEDIYAGIEFQEGKPETAQMIHQDRDRVQETDSARLGPQHQGALDHRLQTDRELRLRVRADARPPQGDGRPQGQHHEVHRWPLPAGRPGHRQRASGHRVQ